MKLLYVLIVALVALSNIKNAESQAIAEDLTVKCFPSVEINMSQAYFDDFTAGLEEKKLVIGNSVKHCPKVKNDNGDEIQTDANPVPCSGEATPDGWMWNLKNPTSCSAKKTFANDKITFEYVIHRDIVVDANAKVRRQACGCIVVQCQFEAEFDASTKDEVKIIEEKMVMDGKIQLDEFDVTMSVENDTGSAVTDVKLDQILRIKTTLVKGDSDENYKLAVHDCYVTKTSDKDVAPRYDLVGPTGCSASNLGDGDTDIEVKEGSDEEADIALKSFVWLNTLPAEQTMYFHCKVQVCVASHTDCVAQLKECPNSKRKARSALLDHAVAPEEHMISVGPITVDKSVDEAKYYHGVEKAALPCSLNNGNCAEVCVNTYGSGHVCACRPGRILNQDGRTCMDYVRNSDARTTFVKVEPAQTSSGSSSDSMFVVAAVAIIAVLNIIGVLLVVSRKGKQFPV